MNKHSMDDRNNTNIILQADNVSKIYKTGKKSLHVLKNVDLQVQAGKNVCIRGVSGAGKSTLLHILAGLDKEFKGKVYINNKKFYNISERKKCRIRNKNIGFVFQFYNLLPEFTAQENVAMPLIISGVSKRKALKKADNLLKKVDMHKRLGHKPSELSGGEQQRVAIARALAGNPAILFCDEPTGNLDEETSIHIQDLLLELSRFGDKTLIIVTHDEVFAKKIDVRFNLNRGRLEVEK